MRRAALLAALAAAHLLLAPARSAAQAPTSFERDGVGVEIPAGFAESERLSDPGGWSVTWEDAEGAIVMITRSRSAELGGGDRRAAFRSLAEVSDLPGARAQPFQWRTRPGYHASYQVVELPDGALARQWAFMPLEGEPVLILVTTAALSPAQVERLGGSIRLP